MIGAKYLGEVLGYNNIACSDIGGTSFDVALTTQGELTIKNDPDMARLVLSLPLVAMDSVGAGAGSFIRLDPYTADAAGIKKRVTRRRPPPPPDRGRIIRGRTMPGAALTTALLWLTPKKTRDRFCECLGLRGL